VIFLRGVGGEKKLRGRSPVPLTGTIKEPHTDIFPLSILFFLSSCSDPARKFPRWRGFRKTS
jgi:hypothetical protein